MQIVRKFLRLQNKKEGRVIVDNAVLYIKKKLIYPMEKINK